jgi:pentose-5-phosphate-3-epimerase
VFRRQEGGVVDVCTKDGIAADLLSHGMEIPMGMEKVLSQLQALDGANTAMTLEVKVNVPGGIDDQTARIVLENSAALMVKNPGLYRLRFDLTMALRSWL